MKNNRALFFWLIVVAAVFFITRKGPVLFKKHGEQREQIRFGVVPDYPPFFYKDDSGQDVGFDVVVATEIARRMGREPKFVQMPLAALVLALSGGKIDAIITGFEESDIRRAKMNMITYFQVDSDSVPLVFWKENKKGLASVSDFIDKQPTVAIESGSAQLEMCKELGIGNLKEFSSYLDIIMELRRGSCDVAIFDPQVIGYYKDKNKELMVVDMDIGDAFKFENLGIGVSHKNSELAEQITKHIKEMTETSLIEEFAQTWKLK